MRIRIPNTKDDIEYIRTNNILSVGSKVSWLIMHFFLGMHQHEGAARG
jgi:hypothetical protein